jgi:hypothetical protein
MYLVDNYWVEKGSLDFTAGGAHQILPLDALDMPMTRQLNIERGTPFNLTAKRR